MVSMSAERCSNRAEDTSVWAVMLQETAVRLRGLCASEGEEVLYILQL
jgi:hypothetical protein